MWWWKKFCLWQRGIASCRFVSTFPRYHEMLNAAIGQITSVRCAYRGLRIGGSYYHSKTVDVPVVTPGCSAGAVENGNTHGRRSFRVSTNTPQKASFTSENRLCYCSCIITYWDMETTASNLPQVGQVKNIFNTARQHFHDMSWPERRWRCKIDMCFWYVSVFPKLPVTLAGLSPARCKEVKIESKHLIILKLPACLRAITPLNCLKHVCMWSQPIDRSLCLGFEFPSLWNFALSLSLSQRSIL